MHRTRIANNTEAPPYWLPARKWTWQKTKVFAAWRALPTVLAICGSAVMGLRPMKDAALLIAITIGAYLVSTALEYFWNLLFRAPVAIYDANVVELSRFRVQVCGLEEALAKKDPADEYKERQVREWLEPFAVEEVECIRWLLHHGESDENDFNVSGTDARVLGRALDKGIVTGLVKSSPRGTGTAYRIAENYRDAVKSVLHPRPATTPQLLADLQIV